MQPFSEKVAVLRDGRHEIYICHLCLERTGSVDSKGHMYLNVKNGGYRCVRCGGKGWIKTGSLDPSEIKNENSTVPSLAEIAAVPIIEGTEEYKYIIGRGFKKHHIEMYDLRYSFLKKYKLQIIVPIYDSGYRGFQRRAIYKNAKVRWINCRGLDRKSLIYNIERARQYDAVIITEGVFSAIAAGPNAICTFGKEISRFQLDRLSNLGRPLILSLDGGEFESEHRLATELYARGVKTFVVSLPVGKDPADIENYKSYLYQKELVDSTWLVRRSLFLAKMRLSNSFNEGKRTTAI